MPCPTFKQFPRTLDQAFGPHTSHEIEDPPDEEGGYPVVWWFAVTILAALGTIAIVVDNLPTGPM